MSQLHHEYLSDLNSYFPSLLKLENQMEVTFLSFERQDAPRTQRLCSGIQGTSQVTAGAMALPDHGTNVLVDPLVGEERGPPAFVMRRGRAF